MELLEALLGSAWMLLVPGLPFALLLTGASSSWWDRAAVCPLLSLGANYLVLDVCGRLGLHLDLRAYGALLTVATVVAVVLSLRRSSVKAERPGWALLLLLVPVGAAAALWWAAFHGYAFLAANQDAVNHNFWITRVVDRGSVVTAQLRVSSPLESGSGAQSFYPFAWHAEAGTGSALFGAAPPLLSIVSTVAYWSVALSVGLVALARRLTQDWLLVGVLAGCLAQVVPLVPGVPMSWGAMPSVIGVALLPSALLAVIDALERPGVRASVLLLALVASLFFTHSPEGATAVTVLLACTVVQAARGRLTRGSLVSLLALGASALLATVVFLPALRDLAGTLSALLGGNERSFTTSLRTFVNLSINVPDTQWVFGLMVLAGAALALRLLRGPWLVTTVVVELFVYLVAGASSGPLVQLRSLTAPWYGSYERTAWVAVPFLSMLAALPLVWLVGWSRRRPQTAYAPLGLAALLVGALAWQGGSAVLAQLRRGIVDNQVAGPGAERVFAAARQLQADGIILSQAGDGSDYAYMYDDVRVTGGAFDRRGPSSDLQRLIDGLHDLCALPQAGELLRREQVSGFLLGTRRVASQSGLWSARELRALPGTAVVSSDDELFLLRPALETCP